MSIYGFDPVATALSQAEVLENIFRFLPTPSLTACCLVSPKWTVEAARRLEQEALIRLDSTKLEKYGVIMAMKACRLNQQTPRPHESLSFTLDYRGCLDLLSVGSLAPVMDVVYPKIRRLCLEILYREDSQIKIIEPHVVSQLLPFFKNITHFKLIVIPPKTERTTNREKTDQLPHLGKVVMSIPNTPMFNFLHTVEFELAFSYAIGTPPGRLKALANRIIAMAGEHVKLGKVYTKFANGENNPLLQLSTVDNPKGASNSRVSCDMTTYMLDAIGVAGREELHEVQVTSTMTTRILEKGGFTGLRKVQMELFNSEVDYAVRFLAAMKDQLVEVSVCINGGSRKEVEVPVMPKLETFEIWTANDLGGCRLHAVKLSNLQDAYPVLKSIHILSHDIHIMEFHLNNVLFFEESKTRNVKTTARKDRTSTTSSSPFPKLEMVVICIRKVEKEHRDTYNRLVGRVKGNGYVLDHKDYNSEGLGSKF